jgi:dihydroneopterin aldolase
MNQNADCIHVRDLEVFARVGVTENERLRPQRITISLTIWPKSAFETLQDDISRTVNYSELCRVAREFIEARSDKLIETLASELASHLLEHVPIQSVEIELRKFVLPDAKHVAVIVKRNAAHD